MRHAEGIGHVALLLLEDHVFDRPCPSRRACNGAKLAAVLGGFQDRRSCRAPDRRTSRPSWRAPPGPWPSSRPRRPAAGVLPSVEIRIWLRKTCSLRTNSVLVLLVVLLHLGIRDVHAAQLTSCPMTRCVSIWFFICGLKSSNVIRSVADKVMELVGIGDLLLHLDLGEPRGDSASTLMFRSLPFCTSRS